MSQARAAAGMDRLPWLADEPTPRMKRGRTGLTPIWAVAGTLIVAGASYWIGVQSADQQPSPKRSTQPATTVVLPQPRPAEPQQPQVIFEPPPQVSPSPQRDVPIAQPRVEKRSVERRAAPRTEQASPVSTDEVAEAAVASLPAEPAPTAAAKPLTAWPASRSGGAAGRIVRIGAFGTRQQAKLGWRYMVQAYPAVAHLKATVVGETNSRGRHFYSFQIGTSRISVPQVKASRRLAGVCCSQLSHRP